MTSSTERVASLATKLNEAALPLCLQRLDDMGERESGAYNFYSERVRRGSIFGDYELALAAALLEWPQAPRKVHEIGCGYSTLSLLLAGVGFRCTGLEVDPRRYAGAIALQRGLQPQFPDIVESCLVLNQRFPSDDKTLCRDGALAITTNLVFTTTQVSRAAIIDALARYPWAIVDVDRFLTHVRAPDERAARLADFEQAAFVGESFLDLGPSAQFYRFGDGVAGKDSSEADVPGRPGLWRRLTAFWRKARA